MTKTIKEQLTASGVDAGVAQNASDVALAIYTIGNPGVSTDQIVSDREERSSRDYAKLLADVQDGIRLLEQRRFIWFEDGLYYLTNRGERFFE